MKYQVNIVTDRGPVSVHTVDAATEDHAVQAGLTNEVIRLLSGRPIVRVVAVPIASMSPIPRNQGSGTKCVSGESAMEHFDHNQGVIPPLAPGDDGR